MKKHSINSLPCRIGAIILLYILAIFLFSNAPLGDLSIYNVGSKIFWNGANPYSTAIWNAAWLPREAPPMVWNPPVFFILYAPIYFISTKSTLAITLLSVGAFILTIFLAWKLATPKIIPARYYLLLPLLSFPFLFDLQLGQITAFLSLVLILGLTFYGQGNNLIAGIILSILCVKPHIFYLPLYLLVLGAIIDRRYKFLIGFIGGVSSWLAVVEFLSPGIIIAWLSRDEWPMSYAGSTFCSLIRGMTIWLFNVDFYQITYILPLISLSILTSLIFLNKRQPYRLMPLSILVSPVLAPYGFLFDQVYCVIPIIWLLAVAEEKKSENNKFYIIFSLSFSFLLTLLVANLGPLSGFGSIPVWWFIPSVVPLFFWFYTEKFLKSGLVIQEACSRSSLSLKLQE